MAVVNGTFLSCMPVEGYGGILSRLRVARVQFTLSGTYAQADNAQLQGVGAAIAAVERDGKTVTLRDAMCGHHATKLSDTRLMMGLKTIAISTDDITFEVTESATANALEFSTELANGAVPTQDNPFELIVSYTVA